MDGSVLNHDSEPAAVGCAAGRPGWALARQGQKSRKRFAVGVRRPGADASWAAAGPPGRRRDAQRSGPGTRGADARAAPTPGPTRRGGPPGGGAVAPPGRRAALAPAARRQALTGRAGGVSSARLLARGRARVRPRAAAIAHRSATRTAGVNMDAKARHRALRRPGPAQEAGPSDPCAAIAPRPGPGRRDAIRFCRPAGAERIPPPVAE